MIFGIYLSFLDLTVVLGILEHSTVRNSLCRVSPAWINHSSWDILGEERAQLPHVPIQSSRVGQLLSSLLFARPSSLSAPSLILFTLLIYQLICVSF